MTMMQVETPPATDEHALMERLRDIYQAAKDHKAQMLNEWKRNYRVTMNRAAPAGR